MAKKFVQVFHKVLLKNSNEHFGQPNSLLKFTISGRANSLLDSHSLAPSTFSGKVVIGVFKP